jgi:hypothetical protein
VSKIASIKKKAEIPISDIVKEYDNLRTQAKTVKSRMEELSKKIKDYVEKNGTKDDKGSFFLSVDGFSLGKVCKKSIKIDQETAISFLKKKKLKEAIITTESVDEVKLEQYVTDGTISLEELEKITTESTSYSVDVKKESEMQEVEKASVSIAASKKPKISARKK